jgi:hypothetical protein
MVTDTEIDFVLTAQPSVTFAAAACAEACAAKYARQVSMTIGATSVQAQQRTDALMALAARLRAGGAGVLPGGDGSGSPTMTMAVGGLSYAERDSFRQDADRIQPPVSLEQDDKPGVPDSYYFPWER